MPDLPTHVVAFRGPLPAQGALRDVVVVVKPIAGWRLNESTLSPSQASVFLQGGSLVLSTGEWNAIAG